MPTPSNPVVRIAQASEAIFIDLANPAGQLVQITATGWRILTPPPAPAPAPAPGIDPEPTPNPDPLSSTSHPGAPGPNPTSPILPPSDYPCFTRPTGMLPLPLPAKQAPKDPSDIAMEETTQDAPISSPSSTSAISNHPSEISLPSRTPSASSTSQIRNPKSHILSSLRPLLNLPDDNAWVLFISWLIAALRPGQPCPVLALTGEQGTGKTTLARIARALIDPHEVPLHAPPRQPRDLANAAAGGWVVAFDNLSAISPSMADGLARMVSGGGFSTGQRDDDGQPALFEARRPVILNGIDDLATRSDLLDRCIVLRLPPIPARRRLGEAQLWDLFEAVRPIVLGALLDAVATGLANAPEVDLANKPRMADFALWVTAAEPALPWRPGAFLAAYEANRDQAAYRAMDSSPLAQAILALLNNLHGYADDNDLLNEDDAGYLWKGTTAQLFLTLMKWSRGQRDRARLTAGLSPRKLGIELRRLAPNLRTMGVEVAFGPHTRMGNTITIAADDAPDDTSDDLDPPETPEVPAVLKASRQVSSSRPGPAKVHIHT